MPDLNLEPLLLDFLQHCEIEANLSQGTIKMYDYYLRHFCRFLKDSTGSREIKVNQISEEILRSYRVFLNRKISRRSRAPIKRSTQTNFLVSLRAFFRYLLINREVEVLAPEKVQLGKTEDRKVKVLNEEEIGRLLQGPDLTRIEGLRDRAILELLFSTGLRVSELAALNLSDLNHKSGEISVVGKGRKIRVVFVSESAAWALRAYLSRRGGKLRPLFVRSKGPKAKDVESFRLSVRSLENLVKKHARKVGLAVEPTPHTLRHTFATDLLRNGADLRSVQELLGHKNVATTQIYTHVTNPQLKEVHRKFHSGNRASD